jgi:hypothetical protein
MGCDADDLALARRELRDMTTERDQLLVIVGAAMKVMDPGQLAAMRVKIAEHDAGGDSAV